MNLDEAWAAAEAALPEWAPSARFISVELTVFRDLSDVGEPIVYTATAMRIEHREPDGPAADSAEEECDGPSPAAALEDLAATLAQRTGKP
jgi:hypothetical protein